MNKPPFPSVSATTFFVGACNHAEATPNADPLPVRVTTVAPIATVGGLRFAASIEPVSEVVLSFKSPGYVERILQVPGPDGKLRNVEAGDRVAKGTVLASVRPDEYRNTVEQARQRLASTEAELDYAKLNFDRAAALYAAQSLTKTDYDAAKARFDSATAQLQEAQAGLANAQISLQDCSIKAPMDSWLLKPELSMSGLWSVPPHRASRSRIRTW